MEEQPLLIGVRMRCPWCKEWQSIHAYIYLMIPPDFPKQSAQIYKCQLCKMLFSFV